MKQKVRDAIRVTRDRIAMNKLMIKLNHEYADPEHFKLELWAKQRELAEIQRAIATIKHKHYNAHKEIAKYERQLTHEKKTLTMLLNAKLIDKLKATKEQLKEMTDVEVNKTQEG